MQYSLYYRLLFDEFHPLTQQELHSSKEQRYTRHDSVAESCAKCNHHNPSAHAGYLALNTLFLNCEQEVYQGAESSGNIYDIGDTLPPIACNP